MLGEASEQDVVGDEEHIQLPREVATSITGFWERVFVTGTYVKEVYIVYSPENEETALSTFYRKVDQYGQKCAEEAGTGLSDDMIAEYRALFFEYNEDVWEPKVEEAFDDYFRGGWDFYRYCVAD